MTLADKLRTGSVTGEELATLAKSLGIPVHPRTHANLRRRVIAASRKGFSTHRDWTPNTAAWLVLAKCIEQIDTPQPTC